MNLHILIASVLLLTSFVQDNSQYTIDQVMSSPFPTELIASPVGNRIAWVLNSKGRRNIWIAQGPTFQARQLTQFSEDDGQELTQLSFTHDGKWIIFVRGGDQNQNGDTPNPTSDPRGARQAIFAISADDGRPKHLALGNNPVPSPVGDQIVFTNDDKLYVVSFAEGSEPHPLFSVRGNNGSAVWSPNGKQIAFVSRRSGQSYVAVFDFEKENIRYLAPSVDRDWTPRWSPDGKYVAFVRQPARGSRPRPITDDQPDPWTIMLADVSSPNSSVREVWKSGDDLNSSPPRIAGDALLQWGADNTLIFASEMDGWMRLYAVAVSGGAPRPLTPPACEFEHAALTPDKLQIVYSSNCGDIDRRHLARVSIKGGNPVAITSGDGLEWDPVITADSKYLFYAASDARKPAMPWVRAFAGGSPGPQMLAESELPKDFPSRSLVVPEPVLFKGADGIEIHAQLFKPPSSRGAARMPAVLFMHGGPARQMMLGWHNRGYYHHAYAFNQYLASRGYMVLSVNYRAGIMYGRGFREAKNRGARGAAEYQDIVNGALYLKSRADVDPARIGLWGGSYGGFLTAMGLARNSDIFAAGVDIHGVHDWSLRISNSPWIDYNDRDAQRIARESSPISSVSKWKSPVLLVHGDDDRNVAFSQTVDLVQRLREQKVHYELIVYPDEVHDFLIHKHWIEIFSRSADFLDRFLKNAKAKAEAPPRVGQNSQK